MQLSGSVRYAASEETSDNLRYLRCLPYWTPAPTGTGAIARRPADRRGFDGRIYLLQEATLAGIYRVGTHGDSAFPALRRRGLPRGIHGAETTLPARTPGQRAGDGRRLDR